MLKGQISHMLALALTETNEHGQVENTYQIHLYSYLVTY